VLHHYILKVNFNNHNVLEKISNDLATLIAPSAATEANRCVDLTVQYQGLLRLTVVSLIDRHGEAMHKLSNESSIPLCKKYDIVSLNNESGESFQYSNNDVDYSFEKCRQNDFPHSLIKVHAKTR